MGVVVVMREDVQNMYRVALTFVLLMEVESIVVMRDVQNMYRVALTFVLLMEVESVVVMREDVLKVHRAAPTFVLLMEVESVVDMRDVLKVHRVAPTFVKLMEVRSIAVTLSVKDPSLLEENVVRIKRIVLLQDAQVKVVESTVSVRNTSHRNTSSREIDYSVNNQNRLAS
mmetsp:Transcript_21977/g.37488  ORF Transcript_21977/g.37488 Transcript_21977/m.37488 type:complete len:171 (-) Transcript_21977:55-567(-)